PPCCPLCPLQYPATALLSTLSLHDALPIYATPGIGRARRDRRGLDDSGQLAFKLDRTVLVKVPVETVVVIADGGEEADDQTTRADRKSTRLNSSHQIISYAVFCLKKKIRQR